MHAGFPIVDQSIYIDDKLLVEINREYNGKWVIQAHGQIPRDFVDSRPQPVSYTPTILDPETMKHNYFSRDENEKINLAIDRVTDYFRQRFKRTKLLQSTRGNIEYSGKSTVDSDWVGTNGEYLLQVLSKIFSDSRYRNIRDQIIKWSSFFRHR